MLSCACSEAMELSGLDSKACTNLSPEEDTKAPTHTLRGQVEHPGKSSPDRMSHFSEQDACGFQSSNETINLGTSSQTGCESTKVVPNKLEQRKSCF